jgi:hypothetical protein
LVKRQICLLYFPDPQEELVENCSLQAGAYTQRQDYLLHIRDFLRYPQLCELFNIATIDLGINEADNGLILGLESISHQQLIAKDGVTLPREGRMVELIALRRAVMIKISPPTRRLWPSIRFWRFL